MYLTDEIFKTTDAAATADHPYNSPSTQPMDSSTPSEEHLGKRKRGAAGDHEYTTNTVPIKNIKILPTHLDPFDDYPPPPPPYSSQTANPATLYPSPPRHRKTLLPRMFAQQQQQQQPRRNNNNNNNNNTTYLHAPVRPAQRSPVFSDNHHQNHHHQNHHHHRHNSVARPRQPSSSTTTTTSTTDLTPCHCCHRAPRQKPDLDNYSACAACGARTCYICMRVCERRVGCGSGGSRGNNNNLYATEHENENEEEEDADAAKNGRKICRECCVESGPEGETWCFDCVAVGGGAERGEEEAEGMVMG